MCKNSRVFNSVDYAISRGEKEAWYVPFKVGESDEWSKQFVYPRGYTRKTYTEATAAFESNYLNEATPKVNIIPLTVDQVIGRHNRCKGDNEGYFKWKEETFWSSIPDIYAGKKEIPQNLRVNLTDGKKYPVAYIDYSNFSKFEEPEKSIPLILDDKKLKMFPTIVIVHDKPMREAACEHKGVLILRWSAKKLQKDGADDIIFKAAFKDSRRGKTAVFTKDQRLARRFNKTGVKVVHYSQRTVHGRKSNNPNNERNISRANPIRRNVRKNATNTKKVYSNKNLKGKWR
jgi:hypothetical protein